MLLGCNAGLIFVGFTVMWLIRPRMSLNTPKSLRRYGYWRVKPVLFSGESGDKQSEKQKARWYEHRKHVKAGEQLVSWLFYRRLSIYYSRIFGNWLTLHEVGISSESILLSKPYSFSNIWKTLPPLCLFKVIFTFYHGKSPSNHHLGNVLFFSKQIKAPPKNLQENKKKQKHKPEKTLTTHPKVHGPSVPPPKKHRHPHPTKTQNP